MTPTKPLQEHINDFYNWALEADPTLQRSRLVACPDDYARFCVIAEKLGVEPPDITNTILFSIAKIKAEWADK